MNRSARRAAHSRVRRSPIGTRFRMCGGFGRPFKSRSRKSR